MKRILLIILTFLQIFAFANADSANLTLNSEKADINENIELQLSLESENSENFSIEKINWIENFDIIWQSQSTSLSSIVINWKSQTKVSLSKKFTLKAKKTWTFEIGPVIISNWTKEIKTNSVKLEISWTKLQMLNNSSSLQNISPKNTPKQINLWKQESKKEDEIEQKERKEKTANEDNFDEKVDKKVFVDYSLIIFIFVIIFSWIGIFIILRNNHNSINTN